MTTNAGKRLDDTIELRHVHGSGNRPRTVWYHERFGCWHGSYRQAQRCEAKAASAAAKRDAAKGGAR